MASPRIWRGLVSVRSPSSSRHGKPYALIQPITEQDLEFLEWKRLATRRLSQAWEGEEDAFYDYL
jgi:hypothetical protein